MTNALSVCLLLALSGPAPEPTPEPPPGSAPLYTNADLERLRERPLRNGSASTPAIRFREPAPEAPDRTAEEARWRREADALREKQRGLEDEIGELTRKIRERRRQPGVPPYSDPRIRSWEERVERLESRIRDLWARFRARARRARIPPGWLR